MDLKEAYFHFKQSGDLNPFVDQMITEIIFPFVSGRNYWKITKLPGFEHLNKKPFGEGKIKVCKELAAFLLEKLIDNKFFDRYEREDQISNLKSYLYWTLINALHISRYDVYNSRFQDVFDQNKEQYYFWIGRNKAHSTDEDQPYKKRNYYLARWEREKREIPDLLENGLSAYLGYAGFKNQSYTHSPELKALIDEGFDRTESSLRIKHFLDFLIELNLIEPKLIRQPDNQEESLDEWLDMLNARTISDGSLDTLVSEDIKKIVEGFIANLKDEEFFYLYWLAQAIMKNQNQVGNFDYFKEASQLAQEDDPKAPSPNSFRNHLIKPNQSVLKTFRQRFIKDFGNDNHRLAQGVKFLFKKTLDRKI